MIRKLIPFAVILLLFPALALAQGALPDATDPAAFGSFVWRLYKAGHLVPAIIVAAWFALTFAEKRWAWLSTGPRKVYVAAALAGLGMLAERVANGTTPNIGMWMGAFGAAFTMWMKTHGPAPAAEAKA